MPQPSNDNVLLGHRYALCVGIGTYTNLINRSLRYAAADARTIAERLADPQRGNFVVTVLTEPTQTNKVVLEEAVEKLLSAPDRQAEDLTVIYFSCHGDVYTADNTFYLLPSNATLKDDGTFEQTTVISIRDLARWFSRARTQNIVMLLDVCHSGGAVAALQHFKLDLSTGPNFFIIGAARQDQVTRQSSLLQHGLFTHCLLRAFEQPPTKDGWLTVSQINIFVSDEIPWFAKDQPTQIQSLSVSVNPNLALLRNPCYPELSPLPPLWNVPLQRNPFFTGQEDLLSQLANMLQSEQKTALTQAQAISGLGGIGKTQLALEYAYRHRQDYHAILWGRADTHDALISTFVNIARLLDLPQKDEKDQMVIVEVVKAWLADRSNWLFILDNADELVLVKEFIPPAFRGHLLLTTQAEAMGGLARKLEVEVMQPEVGALLLLRRAGLIAPDASSSLNQASSADVAIAKELSQEMGGLPLALDQAGAYIEETDCSLLDYQQLYRAHQAKLLRERGGIVSDHPEPIATTLFLAFQKVEQASAAAADLLRVCAFLHPDAIPEEFITEGASHLGLAPITTDPLLLNRAIRALRAYSLVRRDASSKTLSVHRLVQAVVKDGMKKETIHLWIERVVEALDTVLPDEVEYPNWERYERCISHVQACMDYLDFWQLNPKITTNLLYRAGEYLTKRARYREAEPLLKRALHILEQALGPEQLQVADALIGLANLYQDLVDRGEEAERLYQRALNIQEKILGPDHAQVATPLYNLGSLYRVQGRYEEAERLLQRALHIWEQTLGPEQLQVADALIELANLYQQQRRYGEAEPLLQRALNISEQALGPEDPRVAHPLYNLANLYREQGKYEEAERLFPQALHIWEQTLGPEHPDLANVLNGLGDVYREQGKYEEAERLLQRALHIYEQALGSEHRRLAHPLYNLATLYAEQGKYEEAEPLFQRALRISEQALGPEHPQLIYPLNGLADFYREQERYEEAEPLYQRALRIQERTWGPEHPEVTSFLDEVAKLYFKQGKYEQAEPLLQRALAIREKQLGPAHPDTATVLNNLAVLYHAQGKYEQAEPLSQRASAIRALAIKEKQLGPAHPDIARSLNNLALLYQAQGKYEQAEPLYQRAFTIYEQQLGPAHPYTAQSLNNLATLYLTQGKYEQAEPLLQRALAIKEKQLGPAHPDTAMSLNNLAGLYGKQGKYEQAEPLYQRAFTIYEQQLGPAHPYTAQSLNNLAVLYHDQGKYEQAELFYQRALTIYEQQLGPAHPYAAAARKNYNALMRDMKQEGKR